MLSPGVLLLLVNGAMNVIVKIQNIYDFFKTHSLSCELQDGILLVLPDKAVLHYVSGTPPSTGFTVFPGVALPQDYDLASFDQAAALGGTTPFITCSVDNSAPNLTQINTCAQGFGGRCCIDTTEHQVGDQMPAGLKMSSITHQILQSASTTLYCNQADQCTKGHS